MNNEIKRRNGLPIKPSPYSPSSDIEENAIKCFRNSVDASRIKPHVAEGDKTPNHDGFIEILNTEHVPVGKITVQLKGTPKGESKFQCEMETLAYSRTLSEPFLLICVDSANNKIYWKQICYDMPEAKDGQDSFVIHFSETDAIDNKGTYIEKWINLCKEYQKIHSFLSKKSQNNWQEFKNYMRLVASAKWNTNAKQQEINGIKYDCVLQYEENYWIIVEITEESSLGKLEEKLTNFETVIPYLHSKNIYVKAYLVVRDLPRDSSLRKSGESLGVVVLDQEEFCNLFWNFNAYFHNRGKKSFGSAVNPKSGENDELSYIRVKYKNTNDGKQYTLEEIKDLLLKRKTIVLIGDYGTGKSRCFKELFFSLANECKYSYCYPIAINLRENWGLQNGLEIINRHFNDLGLEEQASFLKRIIEGTSLCFLLDGLDEISSQVWSDDPIRLAEIRKRSLAGVKSLLSMAKGGVLVSGREHYFNSTKEIIDCLGLKEQDTIFLECANEFSEAEAEEYIGNIKLNDKIPNWFPRKPLLVQLFAHLETAQIAELVKSENEALMGRLFIEQICKREAAISHLLEADTIKSILIYLARLARTKTGDLGPLSIEEINDAFTAVVGTRPVDESAVMLQRLPGLARFEAESRDRKFLDYFLVDPLRAEDMLSILMIEDEKVFSEPWMHSMRSNGIKILAQEIDAYTQFVIRIFKQYEGIRKPNYPFAADLLLALIENGGDVLDLHNINANNLVLEDVNFENRRVKNIHFRNCLISNLRISNIKVENISLTECPIVNLYGISDKKDLPDWFIKSVPENILALHTLNRIKAMKLAPAQQLLVATLKRTFKQKGSARKAQSILKGFGNTVDTKLSEKILKLLLKEKLLSELPGDDGPTYKPARKYTARVDAIINQLTLSEDPIWIEVSSYDK